MFWGNSKNNVSSLKLSSTFFPIFAPAFGNEQCTMNNEQLAMPARNLTYRPTAVRSLFTAHSSLAEIYSFPAKERDTETGLSVTSLRSVSSSSLNQTRTSSVWYSLVRRFGARYYSSDLSIWLSVDPMSGKYPSLSPYVYCADNPVKCVDLNGEEVGDYRKWDGELLGSDGYDDFNVYFVSDIKSIEKIEKDNNLGRQTNSKDVVVDWETNIFQLQSIVSVYNKTVINGGSREEATVYPKRTRPSCCINYPTGNSDGTIDILSQGYISIHSHRLDGFECPDALGVTCYQSPFEPSEEFDKHLFKNYKYNIIVGNRSLTDQTAYAVCYDSQTNKLWDIKVNTLRDILNYMIHGTIDE